MSQLLVDLWSERGLTAVDYEWVKYYSDGMKSNAGQSIYVIYEYCQNRQFGKKMVFCALEFILNCDSCHR
jgi:hypothetical protein